MCISHCRCSSRTRCRISEDDEAEHDDGGGSASIYKLKYERAAKELEFTKRRLQTQHEHDLDQLVGLKKQLEKKLSDAYEEVEEQRQVVGQWKRKNQKLSSEMNDLRMLLEEQNGRNNLLEKRQRKFDAETQSLQVSECGRCGVRVKLSKVRVACVAGLSETGAADEGTAEPREGRLDCREVQFGADAGGE